MAYGLGNLQRLNGFYHDNFVAIHDGERYLIRIKRDAVDEMDPRMFDENTVLAFLADNHFPTVRMLYVSMKQNFSVHTFVEGAVLSDLYPKDRVVPDSFLQQMADNMAALHAINPQTLAGQGVGRVPASTAEFFGHYADFIAALYKRLWTADPNLYAEHDFPADPVAALREKQSSLTSRPIVLLHGDLHQHNVIVNPQTGVITVIDWELALLGDPLFDLASHINRAHHAPAQADYFTTAYCAAASINDTVPWRRDLHAYLAAEYIKSAIVDVYRHNQNKAERMAQATVDEKQRRATRLQFVLNRAQKIWRGETT